MCGRQLLAINVNRVTEGLEGIETDADGKNDLHGHPVNVIIEQRGEQQVKIVNKEIKVLEHTQDGDIKNNVSGADNLLRFPVSFISL